METQSGAPVRKPISSMSVLGARITWALLAPVGLFFATVAILMQGSGWLTSVDLIFGLAVALVLVGRWYEHRSGSATRLDGEPETEEGYRRFMLIFPFALLLVWVGANVVGNHLLGG